MNQGYLPKMRTDTAKKIVKNLITSQKGKKITDTKFKQFLKKNKDLSKFAYARNSSHLTKLQSKKFFSQATKAIHQHDKFKISKVTQKKLGFRLNKSGELSKVGLNKLHSHAAEDELSQNKPAGPTPAEIRREKKRETALKSFHKQDRAREVEKEKLQQAKTGDADIESNPAPIQRQSLSSGQTPAQQGASAPAILPADDSSNTSQKNSTPDSVKIKVLILPLYNQSENIISLKQIVKQLDTLISLMINGFALFTTTPAETIEQALHDLHLKYVPQLTDQEGIESLVNQVKASLYITGSVKQNGRTLVVDIKMHNPQTGLHIKLVSINEEMTDFFAIKKKINWQINNAFKSSKDEKDDKSNQPPEAVDLPI